MQVYTHYEGKEKGQKRTKAGMSIVFIQLPLDLNTHDTLNEIIIWEIHNALLTSIPSSKTVC